MAIEVHFEKRINNVPLLREADSRHRREYLLLTLLVGLFVSALLFYGWQRYQWIQYGYRIEEAQKKRHELEEIGQRLRVERASLRNRQRIDELARNGLGMVAPRPGQMVNLKASGPFTTPGSPEPPQTELASKN